MAITGRVHSIESFGTVDGPGIRFIVFMQGCLMRCQYCHNRDTWDVHGGHEMNVDELMQQILSYQPFFKASGGGVTASGGEAILQAEFVAELFTACQAQGIHTCLDTNGFVRKYTPAIDDLIAHTDLVLLDIKQIDDQRHKVLTKVSNQPTLQFAHYLAERQKKTWIRYVVVGGHTDDLASARALADFIKPMSNIEKVELLAYHELGKHKWETLGFAYELEGISPPTQETMRQIQGVFEQNNIAVQF